MDFIVRNLDSIIISFMFLILSHILSNISNLKNENQSISIDNSNVVNSTVSNIFNDNTVNNTQLTMKNITIEKYPEQSLQSDDTSLTMVIYLFLFGMILIFFYKYFDIIDIISTLFIFICLLSSILVSINVSKNKVFVKKFKNIKLIALRNTAIWVLLFINSFIIYYKVNYSDNVSVFLNNLGEKNIKGLFSRLFDVISRHFYESMISMFLVVSFVFVIVLIINLLASHIWILSFTRSYSLDNKKLQYKFWKKIHNVLVKKYSKLDIGFWIISLFLVLSCSLGLIPYFINKLNNLSVSLYTNSYKNKM